MTQSNVSVFVYGTLQPGEFYYSQYCAETVVASCRAIAHGLLFDLPAGYPAMTKGEGIVRGFLLSFDDSSVLASLDELEEYHPERADTENEYQRQCVEVFTLNHQPLGFAWTYLMSIEQATQLGGILIPHGKWSAHRQNSAL
ncbi:MAG: gamma-glutamylcyclotransferase family protein [Elainellaceae cyanobacterium]